MTKSKKIKILFITPSFSRGGSEMYLFYLLNNIDRNKFEFILFSDNRGELTKLNHDYKIYINTKSTNYVFNCFSLFVRKLINADKTKQKLKKLHKKFQPDLWYINTGVIPKYASIANELNVPYIIHFHELISVFSDIFYSDYIAILKKAKAIFYCSPSIEKFIRHLNNNIHYIQEHVQPQYVKLASSFRIKHKIPENAFVWVMSGQKNYRKGYDFIPEICEFLAKRKSYLIWLGGNRNYVINKLISSQKIDNLIEPGMLTGDEYYSVFLEANAFVLTSREDPYPLVMLEAAYFKLPIVAFNSGGVSDFVDEKMGLVSDGINLKDLLENMEKIMSEEVNIDKDHLYKKALFFHTDNTIKKWEDKILSIFSYLLI
ncbi:MAG: hypothetical protein Kow0068_05330 [Marinilabiliales bacterium]